MTRLLLPLFLLITAPAQAQEDGAGFRLGGARYAAGPAVTLAEPGTSSAFLAGERVVIETEITGSAHLAGRRVTTEAAIGGSIYAFGADVAVNAPVEGDATLAGYDVTVAGAIGADLRAAGAHVHVEAPVAGTALLTGRRVEIDAPIAGDVAVGAERLEFGPDARIDGQLILLGEDVAGTDVPERVTAADRVERRDLPLTVDPDDPDWDRSSWLDLGGLFVGGVAVATVLATIVASLAPRHLEQLGGMVGARPLRSFGIGCLTLSALVGATILLVMTLIGIFAAPAVLLMTVIAVALGYAIAVYLTGRAVWHRFEPFAPDSFAGRVLVALIGAAIFGLVSLVPLFGLLAVVALTVTGLGGLTAALLQPRSGPP